MADFFQNGVIATLHDLGHRPVADLEKELAEWADERPLTLVIPALVSEFDRPALHKILAAIAEVEYLDEIVLGLDGADRTGFERATTVLDRLPQRTRVLWHDGPGFRALDEELAAHGLGPTPRGKGRNVWWCLGYVLASGRAEAVALHDADILTYDRRLLARLVYPVMHPTFGYSFSKGYYARAGEDGSYGGRVARLLVTPMIRALRATIGPSAELDYLDSFRYPLAGEMALRADLVPLLRIPSDWGLEIGVLTEVFRHVQSQRVCQVDVADAYDHKHQVLSPDDASTGLHKMAVDVAKAMFRKLAVNGAVLSPEVFRTVKASYYRGALDLLEHYHNDAILNGYTVDRHRETQAIEQFARAIMTAGEHFLREPNEAPFIASWSRVASAIPDVFERVVETADAE